MGRKENFIVVIEIRIWVGHAKTPGRINGGKLETFFSAIIGSHGGLTLCRRETRVARCFLVEGGAERGVVCKLILDGIRNKGTIGGSVVLVAIVAVFTVLLAAISLEGFRM